MDDNYSSLNAKTSFQNYKGYKCAANLKNSYAYILFLDLFIKYSFQDIFLHFILISSSKGLEKISSSKHLTQAVLLNLRII